MESAKQIAEYRRLITKAFKAGYQHQWVEIEFFKVFRLYPREVSVLKKELHQNNMYLKQNRKYKTKAKRT